MLFLNRIKASDLNTVQKEKAVKIQSKVSKSLSASLSSLLIVSWSPGAQPELKRNTSKFHRIS